MINFEIMNQQATLKINIVEPTARAVLSPMYLGYFVGIINNLLSVISSGLSGILWGI